MSLISPTSITPVTTSSLSSSSQPVSSNTIRATDNGGDDEEDESDLALVRALGRRPKVLIADDTAFIRIAIVAVLKILG